MIVNVERDNRLAEQLKNMSDQEVLDKTAELLQQEDVTKITIIPNRHDRRREAALARKKKPRQDK
jgi:hypothetical protein